MPFRVLTPGTFSLLVDEGRSHHRALGVPVGGAADRAAYALGNGLVGNGPGAVALEITLAGPVLEATAAHEREGAIVHGGVFLKRVVSTIPSAINVNAPSAEALSYSLSTAPATVAPAARVARRRKRPRLIVPAANCARRKSRSR